MAKFKAGDRVRILGGHPFVGLPNDPVGTVTGSDGKEQGFRAKFVVDVDASMQLAFKGRELELLTETAADGWTPKVGDRVRFTDACREGWWFGPHTRHKEGVVSDAEVLGAYDFAVRVPSDNNDLAFVDREHIELLTDAPLTIEAGKFYRTRDGRKVGPMVPTPWCNAWSAPQHFGDWLPNGRFEDGDTGASDLVAECIDEPAPEPASPEQKFKVGDRVRVTNSDYPSKAKQVGTEFTITTFEGSYDGEPSWAGRPDSSPYRWKESELELAAAPQPTESFIVARLTASGAPRPNVRPRVHATLEAASAEAQRLADRLGDEFAVYQRVDSRTVDAGPVPVGFMANRAEAWLAHRKGSDQSSMAFLWATSKQGEDFWSGEWLRLTHVGRAILKKWIAESEATQQVAA